MSETIPQEFWQGVELFNTGEFYACHDTLEALWMESTEPDKSFYQGILQISVALYHLGNGNLKGAIILLGEGTNRLAPYPSIYSQVDVDELLEQSIALLKALQQNLLEQIDSSSFEADTLPLPRIIRVEE
jgi:predicted metal-dependent hydrolase